MSGNELARERELRQRAELALGQARATLQQIATVANLSTWNMGDRLAEIRRKALVGTRPDEADERDTLLRDFLRYAEPREGIWRPTDQLIERTRRVLGEK